MKRRLTDLEKRQIGFIIHYYRNVYFHDRNSGYEEYKQVNFCKNVCSQAQLSRLEHGEVLKNHDIYYSLLDKLNLKIDKIQTRVLTEFGVYFTNIVRYQNDDQLIINYNQYILAINKFQNEFRYNIIYTHYTYALEFILYVINEEYDEASELLEFIEGTLEMLPKNYLMVLLQYIGRLYDYRQDNQNAIKYYLSSIEYMIKLNENNPMIYIDIAYTYLKLGKGLRVIKYLNKCHEIFKGTHNSNILERLYSLYGLLYLKYTYYDESRLQFRKAIKNSIKSNQSVNISKNMYLMALSYLFEGNYKKAVQISNKSLAHSDFEKAKLLYRIASTILEEDDDTYKINSEECRHVYDLWVNNNDQEVEQVFKTLKKMTNSSEDIKLLINYRMIKFYKEHKKYKKALKLLEIESGLS